MPKAIFHTTHGDIKIALFDKTAPATVANFIKLAKSPRDQQFHGPRRLPK
jgi:cyclophilin family peptidyl-prolyl cis-trans isomerase